MSDLELQAHIVPPAPLQPHAQRSGNCIHLAAQRSSDIGNVTEFGLFGYDVSSMRSSYVRAPFVHRGRSWPGEFRLIGAREGDFFFFLQVQESYDYRYKFFRLAQTAGWSELGDRGGNEGLDLGDARNWRPPPDDLVLSETSLAGGALHFWWEEGILNVIADETHAFEHDASETSATNPHFERAVTDHPLHPSNIATVGLSDYIDYNGDMYQEALVSGTPNLPRAIPTDHPIREIDNLHDFEVFEFEGHTLFVRNDYRAGGITDILHLA